MFQKNAKLAKLMFFKAISEIKLNLYILVDIYSNHRGSTHKRANSIKYEKRLTDSKADLISAAKLLLKAEVEIPNEIIESLRLVEPTYFSSTGELLRYINEVDEKLNLFNKA